MKTKRCPKCKEIKESIEFYRDKSKKDGLASWCKVCSHKSNQSYYKNNPDYFKEYYSANIEARKINYKLDKILRVDKMKESSMKYYLSHKKTINQSNKKWKENHPEQNSIYNHNRRIKRSLSGKFTAKEWIDLKNKYGNTCLRCGRKDIKLTQDHVIPISKNGTNTIDNIQPLCLSCNSIKGTKIIDYRRKK